jgi:hypothetical protein
MKTKGRLVCTLPFSFSGVLVFPEFSSCERTCKNPHYAVHLLVGWPRRHPFRWFLSRISTYEGLSVNLYLVAFELIIQQCTTSFNKMERWMLVVFMMIDDVIVERYLIHVTPLQTLSKIWKNRRVRAKCKLDKVVEPSPLLFYLHC